MLPVLTHSPPQLGLSPPRVLMVIPGHEADRSVMIFARRQADALEREGVPLRRFFLTSRTSPAAIRNSLSELRSAVREFHPDILHAQFGTMTAMICAQVAAPRLVVTYRGSDLNPYFLDWRRNLRHDFLRNLFARGLSHMAATRADGIVCVSEQLRDRLRGAERRARSLVLPAGIHLDTFQLVDRATARQQIGWGADERVVVFSANRTPAIKRPDLARAAVAHAERMVGPIRLVVFDGHVAPDAVPMYLNGADALLMTSDFEGSPNIVKEAMACNLPVVSVATGDVPERLRGVQPSTIVARSKEALGAALADVLGNPQRSNGRAVVEATLDDSVLARELIAYYETVCRCPPVGNRKS